MAVKFKKGIDLSGQRAINASDPSSATDLVTKQYADRLVQGVSDLKDPVRGTTTANLAVASALVNGLVHDGVTYATGDRILLKNQTTASENGIYVIVASGAASRAGDANASDEVTRGMSVTVLEGTTKGTGVTLTNPVTYVLITPDPIVLGTTSLSFSPLGGTAAAYTADGQGIELSSNQFTIELDGTTLTKGGSGLRIGSGAAGNGLIEATGVLAVGQGTGITVNADDIAINTAVVVRKYAADCAASTNPQTFTHSLGTNDVSVSVWETNEQVYPDVTKGSGTVIVDWGGAPTAAQYRVVVQA